MEDKTYKEKRKHPETKKFLSSHCIYNCRELNVQPIKEPFTVH